MEGSAVKRAAFHYRFSAGENEITDRFDSVDGAIYQTVTVSLDSTFLEKPGGNPVGLFALAPRRMPKVDEKLSIPMR
jgi:hypothetical protein